VHDLVEPVTSIKRWLQEEEDEWMYGKMRRYT